MYSKAEKSEIKKEFWTQLGKYLKPIPNIDGKNINWINYKTGVKHINIRMDADTQNCTIALELRHPAPIERQQTYEKLRDWKILFEEIHGADWVWTQEDTDADNAALSKIYCRLTGVNIMNKADWPGMISFFKKRILMLDAFWQMVKINFE